MLHKYGFAERDRLLYRHVVYFNVNQIFKELFDGCVQLGIDLSALQVRSVRQQWACRAIASVTDSDSRSD
jgi:hypothetical protein